MSQQSVNMSVIYTVIGILLLCHIMYIQCFITLTRCERAMNKNSRTGEFKEN